MHNLKYRNNIIETTLGIFLVELYIKFYNQKYYYLLSYKLTNFIKIYQRVRKQIGDTYLSGEIFMPKGTHTTGKEVYFEDDELIVSKTDLKGILTYTNRPFLDISGYTEQEVIGKPHNIIRHPDMPRCIFKLLWETISSGSEIFAYVVNRCKNGDHYWVYAHVTPSKTTEGEVIGYHSNRRVPERDIIDEAIIPLYKSLKAIEDNTSNRKEAMSQSGAEIVSMLANEGLAYDEYVMTLGQRNRRGVR